MHCLSCGYDLQQLEEHRCPECGRGFSPDQPSSFGSADSFRLLRWARWSGWAGALIAAGVGTTSAIAIASGKHDFVVLIFYWMIAALPCTAACMAYIACRSACKKPPSKRALLIALLLIVFNASLLTQWPSRASFVLHRDKLNRHAQQASQHPNQHTGPTRIGIYNILETKTQIVEGRKHVILKINDGSGPDYLIYGMTDAQAESYLFNTWSCQRLDSNWHLVHED